MNKISEKDTIQFALEHLKAHWKETELWPSFGKKYWTMVNAAIQNRQEATAYATVHLFRGDRYARHFSADLFGQLCNPIESGQEEKARDIAKLLATAAASEGNLAVLTAIADALAFCSVEPSIAFSALMSLSVHKNDEVRFAATQAFSITADFCPKEGIDRLVKLSRDKDCDIRNWAVFNLGNLLDVEQIDTPEIREALLARVRDRHYETRSEALRGLSYVHDLRGIKPLLIWLEVSERKGNVWKWTIEAAANYGLPEYYSSLTKIAMWWKADTDLMNYALRRCNPDPVVRLAASPQEYERQRLA